MVLREERATEVRRAVAALRGARDFDARREDLDFLVGMAAPWSRGAADGSARPGVSPAQTGRPGAKATDRHTERCKD